MGCSHATVWKSQLVENGSLLPFESRRLNSGSSGSRMWQQVPLPTAPSPQHKFITWVVSTKSSLFFFCKIFIFVSMSVYMFATSVCLRRPEEGPWTYRGLQGTVVRAENQTQVFCKTYQAAQVSNCYLIFGITSSAFSTVNTFGSWRHNSNRCSIFTLNVVLYSKYHQMCPWNTAQHVCYTLPGTVQPVFEARLG